MKIKEILETVSNFPKKPDREGAPPGYARFEAEGRKIIGVKEDGTKVHISSSTPEGAKGIVAIWNSGRTLEKIPLYKLFGSDFYAHLADQGYRMVEKPDSFSYIDEENKVPRSAVTGWRIPVWSEWDAFECRVEIQSDDPITYDGAGTTKLQRKESLYPTSEVDSDIIKSKDTVVEIKLDDGRRYYAQRYSDGRYFRFWIRILEEI
jgi:hypothetical protein